MENQSTILNLTRITKDDVMNDRLTKTDMVSFFLSHKHTRQRHNFTLQTDPLFAFERVDRILDEAQMQW